MKILVMSDTHGNLQRLKHLVDFANQTKVSAIIHCGDWQYPESAYPIQEANMSVYAVLGNADEARQEEIETALKNANVNYEVDTLEVVWDGRKTLVAHQPGKIQASVESEEYGVVFHGHTHQRKDKFIGKTHVINPGAVHNTDNPSFAVYDTESDRAEFFDIVV